MDIYTQMKRYCSFGGYGSTRWRLCAPIKDKYVITCKYRYMKRFFPIFNQTKLHQFYFWPPFN